MDTEWTKEEERVLIEEYSKGTSIDNISQLLNRSRSSILRKRRKLNILHPHFWTEQEVEYLKQEYTKGVAQHDIAKNLNRTTAAVNLKASKLQLKHPRFNILNVTGLIKSDYGNYRNMLLHIIQEKDQSCAKCGSEEYLTINHKIIKSQTKLGDPEEWIYWCKNPEEARLQLEILCARCNKLHYYNIRNMKIHRRRKKALERIAGAYQKQVECFRCGYSEDIRVLEIDHKVKDDLHHTHLFTAVIKMPLEEIKDHYQILCTNCNMWKQELP